MAKATLEAGFVVANNVRALLSHYDWDAKSLAIYLGVTPGAITRALKKPDGFEVGREVNLERTAGFFSLGPQDLKNPNLMEAVRSGKLDLNAARDRRLPPPPPSMGSPAIDRPSALSYVTGRPRAEPVQVLPPGCRVVTIGTPGEGSQQVLVGPENRAPREGDLAVVVTKDQQTWLRVWHRDHRNPKLIILTATSPVEQPIMLREDEITDAWLAIGTLDTEAFV